MREFVEKYWSEILISEILLGGISHRRIFNLTLRDTINIS